ncbi:IS66 family insertion sequence element accessory protein TnpB [Escherichia coli]|uniref:IS66 family insertion sequence element accessory protein TnpB n=1 Tax=Escherichia coli TaxID=562 RepID=UPI003965C9C5
MREPVAKIIPPAYRRQLYDALTRPATHAAGHPPREDEAFLFTGEKRPRMKLLMWDRHGVRLCTRRLHQGTFRWPP